VKPWEFFFVQKIQINLIFYGKSSYFVKKKRLFSKKILCISNICINFAVDLEERIKVWKQQ